MGKNNTGSEKAAGVLRLIMDGTPMPLLPRAEAMVKLVSAHQHEIERQAVGQIELTYSPGQVTCSLRTKLGLEHLEQGTDREPREMTNRR